MCTQCCRLKWAPCPGFLRFWFSSTSSLDGGSLCHLAWRMRNVRFDSINGCELSVRVRYKASKEQTARHHSSTTSTTINCCSPAGRVVSFDVQALWWMQMEPAATAASSSAVQISIGYRQLFQLQYLRGTQSLNNWTIFTMNRICFAFIWFVRNILITDQSLNPQT